jgi:hypothetical protein
MFVSVFVSVSVSAPIINACNPPSQLAGEGVLAKPHRPP